MAFTTDWKTVLAEDSMTLFFPTGAETQIYHYRNEDTTYTICHGDDEYPNQSADQVEELLQQWGISPDQGWY